MSKARGRAGQGESSPDTGRWRHEAGVQGTDGASRCGFEILQYLDVWKALVLSETMSLRKGST